MTKLELLQSLLIRELIDLEWCIGRWPAEYRAALDKARQNSYRALVRMNILIRSAKD